MGAIRYCGRCLSTFEGDPDACPNLGCGAAHPASGWGLVLGEGDVLDRRYRVERCLAVGGAGLTYLAREIDTDGAPVGPRVAIKVLYAARASGPFLRRLSTEAQILQELAHENIVELLGFVHRAGHEPYLVTRFEEGGSLAQHVERLGPLSASVSAGILRQVLLGLDVAHQRGVVHRDLKPDNVLLHEPTQRGMVPRVRVADFGIAKIAGGMVGDRLTRTGAFVGTPEYAAPEQFEGQTPTPATDVFAAGALFVYLLTARPPFDFAHRVDIASCYEELLGQLPYPSRHWPGSDAGTAALLDEVIGHMLVLEPEHRWTIHRVLATLAPLTEPYNARGNTLDMSTSRIPTPLLGRAVSRPPPTADAPPQPPPTRDIPRAQPTMAMSLPPSEPRDDLEGEPPRLAPSLSGDAPPRPPPSRIPSGQTAEFSARAADPDADTDVSPPPFPEAPRMDAGADTEVSPPPLPPDAFHGSGTSSTSSTHPTVLPPPPPDPGASRIGPSPMPPPLPLQVGAEEDALTEATEESLPQPPVPGPADEDDSTVEAPGSREPVPATPLTGPQSFVGRPPAERPKPQGMPRPTAEVPPPPPFVPSLPPTPVQVAPVQVAPIQAAEPPRSGGAAGIAGCFGLSLFGMVAVGGGGLLLSVVVLVVFAAATGWIGGGGGGGETDQGPIVVDDPELGRFQNASPLAEQDRRKVRRAVLDKKDEIAKRCRKGNAVAADLLVGEDGQVLYAQVELSGAGKTDQDCVRRQLKSIRTSRLSAEGTARIDFDL